MACPQYNECPTIKTLESFQGFPLVDIFNFKQTYCNTDFTSCPQYVYLNKK